MNNKCIFNRETIVKELSYLHYPNGVIYNRSQRYQAFENVKENEKVATYFLINSHVPALRLKGSLTYENNTFLKNRLLFHCRNSFDEEVNSMVKCLKELPQEWSVIQLTPNYNSLENRTNSKFSYPMCQIHISVIKDGLDSEPFFISVDEPLDPITGEKIQLLNEIQEIISLNKATLSVCKSQMSNFTNLFEKKKYYTQRQSTENRLQCLIREMQTIWFKEWRCLFIGKYVDKELESRIRQELNLFLMKNKCEVSPKVTSFLYSLIKGHDILKPNEQMRAAKYCFPERDKEWWKTVVQFVKSTSQKFTCLRTAKKHPVILIIEESLDAMPYEMMDVFQDETVSRVPSLGFLYNLFQDHKTSIENGFKIIKDYKNGRYIVNPDKDLPKMEVRMMNFFKYWTKDWTGICGSVPTSDEFTDLLLNSSILSYNGHGSGGHLLLKNKLEKLKIPSTVLLFGCGSAKVNKQGPQAEMFGMYHTYLLARCPCVVGFLWEVTDLDVDTLATEFMSRWLPSVAINHWACVDKKKWANAEEYIFFTHVSERLNNEPNLQKALQKSKRSATWYITKAACVARGLPVKIQNKSS